MARKPAPKHSATICCRIDREAKQLLSDMVPTRYGIGRYLNRLIYEDAVRREAHAEILALYNLPAKPEVSV